MASVQDPTNVPAAGEPNRPVGPVPQAAPAATAPSKPPVPAGGTVAVMANRPLGFIAGLPYNQELALQALMEGKSVNFAAEVADVRRETVFRWRTRDPKFIAAMNLWRRQSQQSITDNMAVMTEKALAVLNAALDKNDLRAAMAVLNYMKRARLGSADSDAVARIFDRRVRKLGLADKELMARESKSKFW